MESPIAKLIPMESPIGKMIGGPKPKDGYISKLLQEDVVYLLIVNMPSEEELRVAREELAR